MPRVRWAQRSLLWEPAVNSSNNPGVESMSSRGRNGCLKIESPAKMSSEYENNRQLSSRIQKYSLSGSFWQVKTVLKNNQPQRISEIHTSHMCIYTHTMEYYSAIKRMK